MARSHGGNHRDSVLADAPALAADAVAADLAGVDSGRHARAGRTGSGADSVVSVGFAAVLLGLAVDYAVVH